MESNQRKNIKADDTKRELLIDSVINGGCSIRNEAERLGIKYRNAVKIIKIFEKEGRVSKFKAGRREGTKKINNEMSEYLIAIIEENSGITLKEMKRKILSKFGINVSLETIRLELGIICITRKIATRIHANVNSFESKIKRSSYARNFLDNHDNDSLNIFIDESGFNLHIRQKYGRSRRGTSAQSHIAASRGRNISLISAISVDEVLFSFCKLGSVKAFDFKEFLESLISVCREKNIQRYTLFFDNAAIHRSVSVKDYLSDQGISYKFLSPYSYMLNPIEFYFSKIKSGVRRRLGENSTNSDLTGVIYDSIIDITSNDLAGYYRHIRRNCTAAIAVEDFLK